MAVLYIWRVFQPQVKLRTWLTWLWNSLQLALESMSQGANLKSMLDLRAALWLVWLVPQPTFFQGHMSTLFGSLASKKKGVGEGWSLDTWKRDQGLLMLDKSFKASGNSSVLCKEERKAEAAQEEACQELKVILLDKQHLLTRSSRHGIISSYSN